MTVLESDDRPSAPPGHHRAQRGRSDRQPLTSRGPLRIGFTGTIGALIAYGLAQAAIQARSVLVLLVVAMFIAPGSARAPIS